MTIDKPRPDYICCRCLERPAATKDGLYCIRCSNRLAAEAISERTPSERTESEEPDKSVALGKLKEWFKEYGPAGVAKAKHDSGVQPNLVQSLIRKRHGFVRLEDGRWDVPRLASQDDGPANTSEEVDALAKELNDGS